MTAKSAFTSDEWKRVAEGPPAAGLIVVTAARGEHGESELLDEIVSAKPQLDHTRYHSPEELRDSELAHLRDAVSLVEGKATADELDDYRRFTLTLAHKVAAAHREHGQDVSPAETAAIEQITAALGATDGA